MNAAPKTLYTSRVQRLSRQSGCNLAVRNPPVYPHRNKITFLAGPYPSQLKSCWVWIQAATIVLVFIALLPILIGFSLQFLCFSQQRGSCRFVLMHQRSNHIIQAKFSKSNYVIEILFASTSAHAAKNTKLSRKLWLLEFR